MISALFIDRPKLAIVISVVILLAGLISLAVIPVAQYPNITPPQIQVSTTYPGASTPRARVRSEQAFAAGGHHV